MAVKSQFSNQGQLESMELSKDPDESPLVTEINQFGSELRDSFFLDTIPGQVIQSIGIDPDLVFDTFDNDPNYNVYRDSDWETDWPGDPLELMDVHSHKEYLAELEAYLQNEKRRYNLEQNEAIFARILPQFLDPVNYLPIPAFKGSGFLMGAAKGGASFAGVAAAQEVVRTRYDRTDTLEESVNIVKYSAAFGSAIGTTVGGLTRASARQRAGQFALRDGHKLQAHFDDIAELSPNEQATKVLGATGAELRLQLDAKNISERELDFYIDEIGKIRKGHADELINESSPTRLREISQNLNDIDAVVAQLKIDRMELKKFRKNIAKSEATLLKYEKNINNLNLKKAAALKRGDTAAVKEITDKIAFLRDKVNVAREAVVSFLRADARISADRNFGAKDLGLKAMPFDLERSFGKLRQMPFYNLIHNRLSQIKEAQEVGTILERTAWEIFNSPDLQSAGGMTGRTPGASVAMRAYKWQGAYSPVSEKIGDDYLRLVRDLENPQKRRKVIEQVGGSVRDALSGGLIEKAVKKVGIEREKPIMSAREYREFIGEWMNSPERTRVKLEQLLVNHPRQDEIINAIENGAKEIETKVHKPMEAAARLHGAFVAQQTVEKQIKGKRVYLAGLKGEADEIRGGNEPNSPRSKKALERIDRKIAMGEIDLEHLEGLKTRLSQQPTQPGFYFHTVYDYAKIQKDPEGLREVIRQHVRSGRAVSIPPRQAELDIIAAEAEEIFLAIRGEALFGDAGKGINWNGELGRLQGRLKELEKLKKKGRTEFDGVKIDESIKIVNRKLDERLKMSGSGNRTAISSPLLGRTLDIPREELIPWIVTDVDRVVSEYTRQMGTAIEMSKMFGDIDMNARLWELEDAWNRIPPDQKTKAMEKAYRNGVQDVGDLRDMAYGTFGMPADPSAWNLRLANAAKSMAVMTQMGKVLFSSMLDSGKIVMTQGMKRSFGTALHFAFEDESPFSHFARGSAEVRRMGAANELNNLAVAAGRADLGKNFGVTGIERAIAQGGRLMFVANLLTTWTDHAKRFAGTMGADQLIRDADLWVQGKLSTERISELSQAGMNKKIAFLIDREWKRMHKLTGNGLGDEIKGLASTRRRSSKLGGAADYLLKYESDKLRFANTGEWADQVVADEFRAILATVVDNSVLTPTGATKLKVMHNSAISVITQYMSFSVLATQSIAGSALQRRDAAALNGILTMVGLAYAVDAALRPDYLDMDFDEKLLRAVERSGVLGILPDLNTRLELVTQNKYGFRPMFGMDAFIEDPDPSRRTGAILGPAVSQWGSLAWAFNSEDATNDDRARALRYMMPFNNLFYLDGLFTGMQRDIEDGLDYFNEE